MSQTKRQRNLKKLFKLDSTAKESKRKGNSRPINPSRGGWETATRRAIPDPVRPFPETQRTQKEQLSFPATAATTNTNANAAGLGGSSRRVRREEYLWLRRALKLHAAKYISDALEDAQISRQQLADEMGVSLGRVHQLLTIKGQFQYERVPLDLLYQIQDITGRRFEMPKKRLVPPANLTKEAVSE